MERRCKCWKRQRVCELLEPKYCLSSIAFESHEIAADSSEDLYAADLDGDGDQDILSAASNGAIAWYENTDGRGTFGPQQVLMTPGESWFNPWSHHAADLDGDGDLDMLTGSLAFGNSPGLSWHENTDGQGDFGRGHGIGSDAIFGEAPLSTADLDGDGDLDVLSAVHYHTGGSIGWYENTDGRGAFGNRQVITEPGLPKRDFALCAADMDGDGDLDLLAAYHWYDPWCTPGDPYVPCDPDGNSFAWYENTDGQATFELRYIDSPSAPHRVSAVDLDGDGDLDVLAASLGDNRIAWHENTDGQGSFGLQQVIAPSGAISAYTTDLDGDGDQDVISASSGSIGWFENTDGQGSFGEEQLIAIDVAAPSVFASDLDGDGDQDLLLAHDNQIAWYENRLIGDANDDGVFDSSDMVKVFVAGKYEDGIPDNATFDEGDWNQDGDFDSSDMVMAFQTGLYEANSEMNANEIAAAVDWLFAQDQRPARRPAYVA